jgi:hypothetical protein
MSRWTRNPITDGSHERERRRIDLMKQLVQTENGEISYKWDLRNLCCCVINWEELILWRIQYDPQLKSKLLNFYTSLVIMWKNHIVSFFFHCSDETVSRHFHNVLRAIISLEDEFLVQPSGRDVPPQILHNNIYYPFFKVLMPLYHFNVMLLKFMINLNNH